ncbi:MAG: PD40 domain-containing protein [Balneolaceae bacterium]|nr:PD40 domain-containing protein [Balneolaceae bacterium]
MKLIQSLLFTTLFMTFSISESAQAQSGIFSSFSAINSEIDAGTSSYNSENQTYALQSSATGLSSVSDSFHYLNTTQSGNFILRARIDQLEDNGVTSGWSVRNSLDYSSAHLTVSVQIDGQVVISVRPENGAAAELLTAPFGEANVIQVERKGGTFIISAAQFGESFGERKTVDLNLNPEVYTGLFTASGTADYSNVRITIPVDDDYVPYQQYIGSRVEILNVETGHLEVVHQENRSLQAPNWTIDGKSLIYNADGLLYNFDLETRTPTVIYSDFATRNNNDHVISFSGELLGISHHSEDHDGQSIVYVMPIEGGTPTLVTDLGPSYLHGWSADDDTLTYTGLRNGQYDIYKISVDGGEEVQLTDTPGLDDGSEYTPDGKYIYFNSERTGTMQIWRMRPDGSQQEQLTFDEYQDWFPHISPDGKTVVFLSYMPEVPSGDHPFYKHVYLRKMPLDGGEPEVIAYLYGGQGTINVPSWSPDSRFISFVSNTQMED